MRGRAPFSQGQDGNEDCSVRRTPCGHRLWPVPSDGSRNGAGVALNRNWIALQRISCCKITRTV